MSHIRLFKLLGTYAVLCLTVTTASIQTVAAQELDWASRAGGAGNDAGVSLAVDSSGNSYVIGRFADSATFGPSEDNETMLVSDGFDDIFVAKYDPAGELLWAIRAGGVEFDHGRSIALDGWENIYVAGRVDGNATFAPGENNQTIVSGDGAFLAKYTSDGALVWAKNAATGPAVFNHLVLDDDGDLYITGAFNNDPIFDPDGSPTVLHSDGFSNVFLAKFDGSGALVWVKHAIGGMGFSTPGNIALDGESNIYLTGSFENSVIFGPDDLTPVPLERLSLKAAFVAKYDSTGTLIWVAHTGGDSQTFGSNIDVDSNGNSYLTGQFEGTAIFDPDWSEVTLVSSPASLDMFLASYDSSGALLWAKRAAGGSGIENGIGITFDDQHSNIYVTGVFGEDATFGPGDDNETQFIGAGVALDTFVAKYDGSGSLVWVTAAGGPNTEAGVDIVLDDFGDLHVTGSFNGEATFGAGESNEITHASVGGSDIFVASIQDDDLNQAPVADAGSDRILACIDAAGTPVTLDGSGSFDPDEDPLTYSWTGPFPEGNGTIGCSTPTVTLGLGTSGVSLVVNDGQLASYADTVQITVKTQVEGLQWPLAGLVSEGNDPPEPDKAFKANQALPLRLSLLCGSQILTDADVSPPFIAGLTAVGEAPTDLDTVDLDVGQTSDNGVLFSSTGDAWAYFLNTMSLSAGKVYEIVIEMPDGLRYAARFALK